MMKFYIVKRDEREGDGYSRIMEFEYPEDLEKYLAYNRGYIEKIKTLDEDDTYEFHNLVTDEKARG
jgi:hypothetical protein